MRNRTINSFRCVTLIFGLSLARANGTSAPGADTSPEYPIKAAYIYNFALFVEWPKDAFEREDSPLVIGIAGDDPFGPSIDQALSGKKVKGRALVIKRLVPGQIPKPCHILFVSASESQRMGELEFLKGSSVLTIGETPSFAKRWGVIGFLVEDNRVRFEINLEAARRAHLEISSRLLSLARLVH
jgi:hypothetical protein